MFIKNLLRRVAEKLTGKKCSRCKHNRCGRCTHPDPTMFDRCWNSVTMPGFTGKYERPKLSYAETVELGKKLKIDFDDGVGYNRTDGQLTEEEQYQFQKIQAALEEAGEIARESGLVEG